MLKGTELLSTIKTLESATRTEQCLACGYVREDGKPAFTSFYEAILEARGVITGVITNAAEKEDLKEEYPEQSEILTELLEDYDVDAIKAFIEIFGEECLEDFVDSYQGEMSGPEFAQQITEYWYGVDLPGFVEIDWNATWENLERYDYSEENGFIFSHNF